MRRSEPTEASDNQKEQDLMNIEDKQDFSLKHFKVGLHWFYSMWPSYEMVEAYSGDFFSNIRLKRINLFQLIAIYHGDFFHSFLNIILRLETFWCAKASVTFIEIIIFFSGCKYKLYSQVFIAGACSLSF